jgi:uncharacterized membrane protein
MSLRFKKNFITGLLVLVPIAIAAWVLYFTFMWIDRLLWDRLRFSFVREGGVPGVGFLIVILVVFLTGMFTNNVFGGRVVRWWENQLLRVPLFNKIYAPTKQVSEAFFAQRQQLFKSVGMVEFLSRGSYAVAFEMNSTPPGMAARLSRTPNPEEMLVVFVPTPPNPATGFVLMVPRREYRVLPVSIEEGIKMVVSCGVYVPPDPVVSLEEAPEDPSAERRGA